MYEGFFNRDIQCYSLTSIIIILCFIFSIAANSKSALEWMPDSKSIIFTLFLYHKQIFVKRLFVYEYIYLSTVHRTCSSLQCLDQFVLDVSTKCCSWCFCWFFRVFSLSLSVFSYQFSKSKNYNSNQTTHKYI